MLKRSKIDLSEERRLLSQIIVDSSFLSSIRDLLNPNLFESSYSKHIVKWVLEYYDLTKEAPQRSVEEIFMRKRRTLSEDDTDMVREFLSSLSKDYEKWAVNNIAYSTKNAVEYLKLQSIKALQETLTKCLDNKDFSTAENLIASYTRVERTQGQSLRMLQDSEAIVQAFTRENDQLFKLRGALGKVVGWFVRGDFAAIQAPPKRGKSWWLWQCAFEASTMGCRTLMISLEMTKEQLVRRAWSCYCGLPETEKEVQIPYFDEDGSVAARTKKLKGVPVQKSDIEEVQKKLRFMYRGGDVRMEVFPTKSFTLSQLNTLLDNLELYEAWVPDVIVIDYADIMKGETNQSEERHRINDIWQGLRGLAQEKNCCILTGSQGGIRKIESDKEVTAGDIAEDARKIAHVTKLIVLNQTGNEKKKGIMRISCKVQRDGDQGSEEPVVVLQSLSMGRPYLDSRLRKDCKLEQS